MLSRTRPALFSLTSVWRKKAGKPADVPPEYKQAYLPYDPDKAPSAAEIAKETARFSQVYHGRGPNRKLFPVKNVPKNIFTYGKEGMTLPIAIFKDQPDPVIGPEWTYPGIYENKIACRYYTLDELAQMEDRETEALSKQLDAMAKGSSNSSNSGNESPLGLAANELEGGYPSPWLRSVLDAKIKRQLSRAAGRMALLNMKQLKPMARERSAAASKQAAKKK